MDHFQFVISEHRRAVESLFTLKEPMTRLARLLVETLRSGNKLLVCGNGGSAADAQHIAAELVNRFRTTRVALPAIALTTDSSVMTSVGNDLGWERVFSRQVEAFGRPGDLLLVISTSGNSPSILAALEQGRRCGCRLAALTGKDGGVLAQRFGPRDESAQSGGSTEAAQAGDPAESADMIEIRVGHDDTARIQECHILIGHYLCEAVDRAWEAAL
jgi:D-sedoheptulose 7-phosphate isomerase